MRSAFTLHGGILLPKCDLEWSSVGKGPGLLRFLPLAIKLDNVCNLWFVVLLPFWTAYSHLAYTINVPLCPGIATFNIKISIVLSLYLNSNAPFLVLFERNLIKP